MCSQKFGNWRSGDGYMILLWASERSHLHGDRKQAHPTLFRLRHGDRKGPPDPTLPPSPLLYDVGAAKPVYSSGESGAMGMGGPLRSPCRTTNRPPRGSGQSHTGACLLAVAMQDHKPSSPLHATIITREDPRTNIR